MEKEMTEDELNEVSIACEKMSEAHDLIGPVKFGKFGSENVAEFSDIAERYWQLACKITGKDPES